MVQRLSSSAPPPPPPFDEAGEEAARRHCVFFHNAPIRVNEATLKRFFERAGNVRRGSGSGAGFFIPQLPIPPCRIKVGSAG
ncbi:unnamed protein product [Durusdinium trenchii]